MKPYKQGNLDRFCVIYSVMNAIRLSEQSLPRKQAQKLFDDIVQRLIDEELLGYILLNGCGFEELAIVVDEANKYLQKYHKKQLHFTRLFWNEKLSGFELCKYIKEIGIVLARIKTKSFDHYSVIRNIDDECIRFFDSDDLHKIKISETSTIVGQSKNQIPIRQIYTVKIECS